MLRTIKKIILNHEDRILKLEKNSHPEREFVRCEKCKCKIKIKEK